MMVVVTVAMMMIEDPVQIKIWRTLNGTNYDNAINIKKLPNANKCIINCIIKSFKHQNEMKQIEKWELHDAEIITLITVNILKVVLKNIMHWRQCSIAW